MRQLVIIVCFLFWSAPAFAQAFVDELEHGAVVSTDRPMPRIQGGLQAVQEAFDTAPHDANVRTVKFDRSTTYFIRLREFMHTSVVLPKGEKITGFSLGDNANFQFAPLAPQEDGKLGNIFEVWGVDSGADTNLVVYGESGNIYSFYLRNDSVKSTFLPDLVVYLEDAKIKPSLASLKSEKAEEKKGDEKTVATTDEAPDYLRALPISDPSNLNYDYRW